MQNVIEFETDTEWERSISGPISRADTTTYLELDDEDNDAGIDMSFFTPEPPPHIRVPALKAKPQQPQRHVTQH